MNLPVHDDRVGRARREGRQARRDDEPRDANPYPGRQERPTPLGYRCHLAWRDGWESVDFWVLNLGGQR